MKKIVILIFLISMMITSNIYADYYSELIDKLLCMDKQREERELIEIELKGRGYGGGDTIIIYKTSVMKIKEIKPIKIEAVKGIRKEKIK